MLLLGEKINLGMGVESVRGTGVAPETFIPARVPTGINVVNEKTIIKETKGSRINSQGSVVTQSRVEGDLEFNLKNGSIGYILKSLFGGVASALVETGVYDHTFTVDESDPQNPSLTLALSQGANHQDYEIPLAVASNLEITVPQDDLVYAVASFIGKTMDDHADYSVAFPQDDKIMNHYNVTVKIADDVAGLAGATATCLKELTFSIANNARPRMCLSSQSPVDVIGLLFDIQGSLGKAYEDNTIFEAYKTGAYKAIEISMINTDETIGATSNPTITFTYPKVSFESYERDNAIDEIANENFSFQAHYDDTEAKAVDVVVRNEVASY